MKPLLTAEQILQTQDIKSENVDVPEWGGTVMVKMFTGAERDAWEAAQAGRIGEITKNTKLNGKHMKRMRENLRARFCVAVIVDKDGKRLFTDEQAEALGQKSSAAVDKIYEVAARLNKMSDRDLDEAAKN